MSQSLQILSTASKIHSREIHSTKVWAYLQNSIYGKLLTRINVSTDKIWKFKLEDGNGLISYFLVSFLEQVQTEGDLL